MDLAVNSLRVSEQVTLEAGYKNMAVVANPLVIKFTFDTEWKIGVCVCVCMRERERVSVCVSEIVDVLTTLFPKTTTAMTTTTNYHQQQTTDIIELTTRSRGCRCYSSQSKLSLFHIGYHSSVGGCELQSGRSFGRVVSDERPVFDEAAVDVAFFVSEEV